MNNDAGALCRNLSLHQIHLEWKFRHQLVTRLRDQDLLLELDALGTVFCTDIALGSPDLIKDELGNGRLCVVGDTEWSSGRGYYLSHPRNRKLSAAAEQLHRNLVLN